MDTNSNDLGVMDVAAAAVTGARHLRIARNGQDAAARWRVDGAAAIVVCDGCGSGASSEVGARLGASLVVRSLAARLGAGARPSSSALWDGVRADVTGVLALVLEHVPGDRARWLHDHFLFTIVAAAATAAEAAVWVIGDGAYALDGCARSLGPCADNQPAYVAYDLLGARQPAHLEPTTAATIVIATDGALELAELDAFAAPRFVEHPDALRRHLAVLARGHECIDWDERRVVRTPAVLQDDCAIGVLRRRAA